MRGDTGWCGAQHPLFEDVQCQRPETHGAGHACTDPEDDDKVIWWT